MNGFSKESLQTLRQRIDLVDVLSPYIQLHKSGVFYKGLCPFHEEKTPSFMVKRGDQHYHCFGCSAHGDAISFLMEYVKMGFTEAVEWLAEKFQVPLEKNEYSKDDEIPRAKLKEALELAKEFYHFALLHTEEGHQALHYLFQRGIDLQFVKKFHLGLSSSFYPLSRFLYHKHISKEILQKAGLLKEERDFFVGRIMIPILDTMGAVIGFSGRSYLPNSMGPKYVNSPETSLFKKSRLLFGLSFSRKRIMQEKRVIIVEGQIDALRMVQEGFDFTVAGQGTAFGAQQAEILIQLGAKKIYLALDGDSAGREAAYKIGDLFQKEGQEVYIIELPQGVDPDLFLRQRGQQEMAALLETSRDYLSYLIENKLQGVNLSSPAQKSECVTGFVGQIRTWKDPVMVYESLKKVAALTKTPEALLGIETPKKKEPKRLANIGPTEIDPDRILEIDLLRWLVLIGMQRKDLVLFTKTHLSLEDFKVDICKKLYTAYLLAESQGQSLDLLSLAIEWGQQERELLFTELFQKKVNKERVDEQLKGSVSKMLERNWMEKKEAIQKRLEKSSSEQESLLLLKEFNEIHKNPPKISL